MFAITRRHVIVGAASVVGATGVEGTALGARQDGESTFRPVEHGYGFRNWSLRDQYFDPPPNPPRASIRERIRTEWRKAARYSLGVETDRFPSGLLEAIVTQVRTPLVQRAGTNGHCYGMVLTAQGYFERPETIPVDRRVASEIEDPTVPVEEPTAPVYEEITRRQAEQYLEFRAWLGRRAMLHPEWIDMRRLLDDVRSVVATFGTATLSLFDEDLFGHQVLAYGFEQDGDGVSIPIYDPNRTAVTYRGETPEIRFESDEGTLSMQPYDRYTHVLFNRYDQIERATDRDRTSPLDHLTVDRARVRDALFPVAVVTVDSADVELTVVDPNGEELDRIRGEGMDRNRGDLARLRSLYGADPGTYRVGVLGTQATDYELTAVVAGPEGTLVDATRTGSVDPGEFHAYDLSVPEEGSGTMTRDGGGRLRPALVGGAGAVVGVAVGAVGYRTLRGLRGRDGPG